MNELWRPIVGWPGYEISSLGRVRSLARLDTAGQRIRERILQPRLHSGGYLRVQLCSGKSKDFFIHRLVLETFVGPCPPGKEGCHNDGNRKNNTIANLRWDTRLENIRDKRKHGTQPMGKNHYMARRPDWVKRGEKCPAAVLNSIDVERIRDLLRSKCTHQSIADWIGTIKRENVGMISRGLTWRHL